MIYIALLFYEYQIKQKLVSCDLLSLLKWSLIVSVPGN